ncbi:MAG: hypothetical protein RXO23_01245 [Vulcanisaeta sp.]
MILRKQLGRKVTEQKPIPTTRVNKLVTTKKSETATTNNTTDT